MAPKKQARDERSYGIGENDDGTVNVFATEEEFKAYVEQLREMEEAAGETEDLSDLGEIEEVLDVKPGEK